jgi:hypothetical protein
MKKKLQRLAIQYEACRIKVEPEALRAFIDVESSGLGFDPATGKIIIQFEPVWFRRHEPYAPSGKWSLNKVERQAREWEAFNDAWSINPESAMKSTSIGLGQVMGFHFERLGYTTVGEMWDDAKKGEERQIHQMAEFINTDQRLTKALREKDWHQVARLYNGAGYQEVAKKYNRTPYNISMAEAYVRHKKQETFR